MENGDTKLHHLESHNCDKPYRHAECPKEVRKAITRCSEVLATNHVDNAAETGLWGYENVDTNVSRTVRAGSTIVKRRGT